MESSKDFPKFAVRQLFGCSGYEISLLNSEEWNNNFQLVHMPLVATSNKMPDDVEVLLVTGGVRTDEDIHNRRKARFCADWQNKTIGGKELSLYGWARVPAEQGISPAALHWGQSNGGSNTLWAHAPSVQSCFSPAA